MLSFLIMFVSLFLWAYSLPLLVFLFFVGVPIVVPLFLIGLLISSSLKLVYTKPIKTSRIRTFFNKLNYRFWFHDIDKVEIPNDNMLICSHPHNVFCLSILLSVHFTPGSTTLFVVAPLVFHIPFLGVLAAHLGCIPASKDSILEGLKTSSVILVPGGVPEIITLERDEMYTSRYGMFKIDAPILPVVSLTKHYYLPPIPFYDLRMFIAKKYHVPVVFPWVFGYYGTWLPKRLPIRMKVLKVKKRNRLQYFQEIKNAMYR